MNLGADALRSTLRSIHDRLDSLERGGATRGQASFSKRIRIGDAYVRTELLPDGTVEVLMQNAITGGPEVVIATLT